ncbi:hypothetical protein AWR36_014810 [Microbulbifer flavimaris]|uniref:Uncharacterized protein n=1 Tax=Microbulbifer flavimaris TaxID=1781068 RepID=A0ABX4HXM3_9GAMM|nr:MULTISPECIES: hypothetical protein [Microbulbifer]KUJ80290.1 hypothetical protein AVO43_14765 [Microbulbifer sp. ZGT114]PCO04338.1 hypothetical protein AWR36_014810 [Microbulbifer flavimaris]
MPHSTPGQNPSNHWTSFLAHFLFILAAWSIFIKYLFPIGFALATAEPIATHVFWDFWPLIHIWLGWALLARPSYTYRLAIAVSVIEIAIIVGFFIWFLSDPDWTIWRTNWFVNKVFVLACFVLLLGTALRRPDTLKPEVP